jgi:hypothetical protein
LRVPGLALEPFHQIRVEETEDLGDGAAERVAPRRGRRPARGHGRAAAALRRSRAAFRVIDRAPLEVRERFRQLLPLLLQLREPQHDLEAVELPAERERLLALLEGDADALGAVRIRGLRPQHHAPLRALCLRAVKAPQVRRFLDLDLVKRIHVLPLGSRQRVRGLSKLVQLRLNLPPRSRPRAELRLEGAFSFLALRNHPCAVKPVSVRLVSAPLAHVELLRVPLEPGNFIVARPVLKPTRL